MSLRGVVVVTETAITVEAKSIKTVTVAALSCVLWDKQGRVLSRTTKTVKTAKTVKQEKKQR